LKLESRLVIIEGSMYILGGIMKVIM